MKCSVDGCDNEADIFLDYQGDRMAVCSECDSIVRFTKDRDVKMLSKEEFDIFKVMKD